MIVSCASSEVLIIVGYASETVDTFTRTTACRRMASSQSSRIGAQALSNGDA